MNKMFWVIVGIFLIADSFGLLWGIAAAALEVAAVFLAAKTRDIDDRGNS